MGWIADLIRDPKTSHVVAKDLFRTLAFFSGLLLCFIIAGADVYGGGREVSNEPALFLLAYALGAQGLKQYDKYQNRRTKDENGNLLAVPGTVDPPYADPKPMPTEPATDAEKTGTTPAG